MIAQLMHVQVLVHPVNACSSTGAQIQVQVQVLEHKSKSKYWSTHECGGGKVTGLHLQSVVRLVLRPFKARSLCYRKT